ncbi:MAG: alkaline phosphatase family protein [Bacillota bacterium]
MRVLLIFVDGVGLGDNSHLNPFYYSATPHLRKLFAGRPLVRETAGFSNHRVTLLGLDASLGVSGLPQSATGQAAIFTGNNAPCLIGSHLNGFPNQALRRLLAREGMFRHLKRFGCGCAFANAYRPGFFDLLRQGLPGQNYSCSTLITYYGGVPFRSLDDLREGRALYMDIDNSVLERMDCAVPLITAEEGGRRLAELSRSYDFTLFEYFLSDLAGHLGESEESTRVIKTLDSFLGTIAECIDPHETLMLVTSDHGNLEDLSHRDHTQNPVPALLIGSELLRDSLAPQLSNLTDIRTVVREAILWNRSRLA